MQSTAEVREGETTRVDFLRHEIHVLGAVRRAGSGVGGVIVAVGDNVPCVLPTTSGQAGNPAPLGPRAITSQDGRFDLLVDEPGRARVSVASPPGRTILLRKEVDIPDVPSYPLILDLGGIAVAGTVSDLDTGQPIVGAFIGIRPKGAPLSVAEGGTDSEGRFQFGLEEGEYELAVRAKGYPLKMQPLTAKRGLGDLAALRITLTREMLIRGRVLDRQGRLARGASLGVLNPVSRTTVVSILSDGIIALSPKLEGQPDSPVNLFASSRAGEVAYRSDVSPAGDEVVLVLEPGQRVRVIVLGPDGQPLPGATVRVASLDGRPFATGKSARTDSQGRAEVLAPKNVSVEIQASSRKLRGSAVASPADNGSEAVVTLSDGT